MNSSISDKIPIVVGILLALSFAFIGFVFLAVGSYQFLQGAKSQDWPATSGIIARSEVKSTSSRTRTSNRHSKNKTRYSVSVVYTYQVDGQDYENNRLSYGGKKYKARPQAVEAMKPYKRGAKVDVFYAPEDPASSVLVKGSGTAGVAIGVGAILLLLGGAASIIMIVRVRRHSEGLPSSAFTTE